MPEFKKFLLIGITFAALSVLFGAFGAHGLKNMAIEAKLVASFETAARYQFYHALGLIIIFLLSPHNLKLSLLNISGWLMVTGTLLFSGSLYIYVLSGIKTFAMITPIGGALMIAAWLTLFIATVKGQE